MKEFLLNPLNISIIIYIIIMIVIIQFKPSMFYINGNTSKLKVFGTGSKKNKTIFPLWFVMLVTAILIYFIVCLVIGKIA
jgi:hypothetical protein